MSNPILPGNKNTLPPRAIMDLPPWQDENSWAQINSFFSYSCRDKHLEEPVRQAAVIVRKITFVDKLLENLCDATCQSCAEPCCQRATIWYDFVDLLFSYLQHKKLPPQQIVRRRGKSCPLLTSQGCVLPRIERPFICTWYVCPAQNALIEQAEKGSEIQKVYSYLREIQSARKLLEDAFTAAVVG
ncbi:MAG: hypothetical protein QNJ17_04810 [Desulfocapsaceae bacterium]|nr:hypothetical protein [Desulfocapsaceae bacterium]